MLVRKFLGEDRIGLIKKNNYGSMMEIVDYRGAVDILVKFLEHGDIVHSSWQNFSKGTTRSLYDKTVHKVGYLGEGEYNVTEDGTYTDHYLTWNRMMERVYSEKSLIRFPSYIGCSIAEEWHNFQNFAAWHDENIYDCGEKLHLDKDILVKGNKVYSPETCVFVPRRINNLFITKQNKRGDSPIGTSWNKDENKYISQCANGKGEQVYLGYFNTLEEAFCTYKSYKETIIKQVANEYKNKIPEKLYITMMKYVVEISD